MMELLKDKRSLTVQLRDRLRQLIVEQSYQAGQQLPSEEALVQMFGVSRATVREALKMLEEERVINVRHGLGRFVAYDPTSLISEDITRLESVTEMAGNLGFNLQTEVLEFQAEIPGGKVRTLLNLADGERVYVLKRIRKADGEIFIYSIDIFSESLPGVPPPESFEGSLVSIMESEWGARLTYSRTTISATMAEDESPLHAGLESGIPWILLEQINYDQDHRPVLYSRDFHRGDKFQFHVVRRRR